VYLSRCYTNWDVKSLRTFMYWVTCLSQTILCRYAKNSSTDLQRIGNNGHAVFPSPGLSEDCVRRAGFKFCTSKETLWISCICFYVILLVFLYSNSKWCQVVALSCFIPSYFLNRKEYLRHFLALSCNMNLFLSCAITLIKDYLAMMGQCAFCVHSSVVAMLRLPVIILWLSGFGLSFLMVKENVAIQDFIWAALCLKTESKGPPHSLPRVLLVMQFLSSQKIAQFKSFLFKWSVYWVWETHEFNGSVCGCLSRLSLCGPVMDWRPVQGEPRLSPDDRWDRLQPPRDPTDGLTV